MSRQNGSIQHLDRPAASQQEATSRVVRLPVGARLRHMLPQKPAAFQSRILAVHPIHALAGGYLRGAEAAMQLDQRLWPEGSWQGGGLGALLGPGMRTEDTAWLLQAACHAACQWNDEEPCTGLGQLRVSVAVPDAATRDGSLLSQVRAALRQSGLPTGFLEVALGERAIADETPENLLTLSALRDMGAGLALARFAGGMDGLRALRRVPLTSVQLDPSLIGDLLLLRDTRAAVRAIINFAHTQNMSVVALGVSSAAQRDILADLGCDEAQGALLGGPLAAGKFATALLCDDS
jgi:EAL domain-containing protein (putative c-di-GMP-specific phosphodiesterase class I)